MPQRIVQADAGDLGGSKKHQPARSREAPLQPSRASTGPVPVL
ncbi:hypothetical protein N8652_00715 [bacterium]|nr:hypothetical protein [bacterium]